MRSPAHADTWRAALGRAWEGGAVGSLAPSPARSTPPCRRLKAAFDPRNQLNPGKIAVPGEGVLRRSMGCRPVGALRPDHPAACAGRFRRGLARQLQRRALHLDPDDPRARRGRAHATGDTRRKGRAQLMREWAAQLVARVPLWSQEQRRLRAGPGLRASFPRGAHATLTKHREPDFSHEVKEAMDGCLACKSCVGQCPIKVDVPTFRAKFFELYHGRYLRPPRHYAARLDREALILWMARVPKGSRTLPQACPRVCLTHARDRARSRYAALVGSQSRE